MAAEAPQKAQPNGIPPPPFKLPYPESADVITANTLKLADLTKDDRKRFLFKNLVTHLHQFARETSLTTHEWKEALFFLTATGQKCTPLRQDFILLSDVLGLSALVDAINNPPIEGSTESSVLGPFYTDDMPDLQTGDSIASEGKGEYMYVEGCVLSIDGTPVPNAAIETWETDDHGFYDTQYADRDRPDCRGRIHADKDGYFGYRAVVPVAYPIPGDGPVGKLLLAMGRHNMRPSHLHLMVEAPGYKTLVSQWYPEGDEWLESDAVFGVKKSLVVSLTEVDDDAEARRRGFPKGGKFKLLKRDIVLVPEDKSREVYEQNAKVAARNAPVPVLA